MGKTIRLTMAQAVAHFLTRQMTVIDGKTVPIFGGVWAIFGHGNVAGMGEALYQVREELPTYRAHNEQAMAHAAAILAQRQLERSAGIVVPDLVGIDLVPMRALAGLEQEVDRGRGAARLVGGAEGLDEMATLGMRPHPEPGDDLLGSLHATRIKQRAAPSP